MPGPPSGRESDDNKEPDIPSSNGSRSPLSEPSDNARDSAVHFLKAVQVSGEQHERFLQLEFKAKKAYECALDLSPPPSGMNEKLVEQISKVLNEVQMEQLADELNQSPPKADRIPHLFDLAHRSLLDALPPRFHEQVIEDLRRSMNWNVNGASPGASVACITLHLREVVRKVVLYGAPNREEKLNESLTRCCRDVEECNPTLGEAVANAFRFLFSAIKQLHEDVGEYSLLLISEDLKRNAATYIRTFVTTCLPPVRTWQSSIEFLKKHLHSPEVNDWMTSYQTPSSLFLSSAQLRVRGALLFGVLDLLRSGGRSGGNRWAELPLEIFYVDKALIFTAANSVQECTLLILLEGAVSSIFKGKGGSAMDTVSMLHRLHSKIMSLFSQDIRLDDLKREVINFIYNLLSAACDEPINGTEHGDKVLDERPRSTRGNEKDEEGDINCPRRSSLPSPLSHPSSTASPASKSLSPNEEQMILSVIDKMANTEGTLYISFEQKVLSYLSMRLRNVDQAVPPLGLITAALAQTTALLSRGLEFHWKVFVPYYDELITFLELQ